MCLCFLNMIPTYNSSEYQVLHSCCPGENGANPTDEGRGTCAHNCWVTTNIHSAGKQTLAWISFIIKKTVRTKSQLFALPVRNCTPQAIYQESQRDVPPSAMPKRSKVMRGRRSDRQVENEPNFVISATMWEWPS